jgi:hypothetical protein
VEVQQLLLELHQLNYFNSCCRTLHNCGVPGLKVFIVITSYGSPWHSWNNPYYVRFAQLMNFFVAMQLKRQRSFLYGLVTMMFWICNNRWRWIKSITPSAGPAVQDLMLHMMLC